MIQKIRNDNHYHQSVTKMIQNINLPNRKYKLNYKNLTDEKITQLDEVTDETLLLDEEEINEIIQELLHDHDTSSS